MFFNSGPGDGFPSAAFDRLFDPPCEPECTCICSNGVVRVGFGAELEGK